MAARVRDALMAESQKRSMGHADDRGDMPIEPVLEIVERVAGVANQPVPWTVLWRSALEAIQRDSSPLRERGVDSIMLPSSRVTPLVPPPIDLRRRLGDGTRDKLPHIARTRNSQHAESPTNDTEKLSRGGQRQQQHAVDHSRSKLPRMPAARPRSHYSYRGEKSPIANKAMRRPPKSWHDLKLQPGKHHKKLRSLPVTNRDRAITTHAEDGSTLLLKELLDDVSREKKQRLLSMLMKIEKDLAESPSWRESLPQKPNTSSLAASQPHRTAAAR